jgi:predicted nucleotidyltransferase
MRSASSSSVRISYPARSRAQLVELLRERLTALATVLPLQRAVLFGSWAAGSATAASDIDLLVVYAGPVRNDAFGLVWKTLQLRGLEPHVYAEAEAGTLQPTIARMTRDGIDLLHRQPDAAASGGP